MNPLHDLVAARAAGRCEYCLAPEKVFNFPFAVEHIAPKSQGGGHDTGNRALACESCNIHKSDHLTGLDHETKQQHRLFNPRTDTWIENFRYDESTHRIEGLTAIGRATIARLKLNSAYQLRARAHWNRIGLFSVKDISNSSSNGE